MARYIDADAMLDRIPNLYERSAVARWTDEAPAADVAPVRHGSWMRYGEDGNPNEDDTCIWQCSQCLEIYYGRTQRVANYCPNCGAKMDGGDGDD